MPPKNQTSHPWERRSPPSPLGRSRTATKGTTDTNNLTIIGFSGGDAQVIDLKKADGSTVTTFSAATNEVRGAGETHKEYTTWHKVTVYGGLQKFASTIERGDLVAVVSGPINTQSFEGKNGKVETYSVRANNLDVLKRKNARSSGVSSILCKRPSCFLILSLVH